ncbi:MAG: AzlC family ABC transporter permease [Burkholderiaceae bacterium]
MTDAAVTEQANTLRQLLRHPEFRSGARLTLSVAPGMAAWGLMTGVAMVKSGLSAFEAVAMTLLVFAGSAQLAALPLIAAGAPVAVILATGFCVNLRFVVFSAHLRDYLMHLPLAQRLLTGYLTTDLNYVLFTRAHPLPGQDAQTRQAQLAFLAGGNVLNWVSWQSASLLGIVLAQSVPTHWGLGFAGTLALIGIACSLATTPLRRVAAGVSAAAAVAAFALPLRLNIVVAIAAAVALCLLLEPLAPEAEKAAAPQQDAP